MVYKIWNPDAESYPAGTKCSECGAEMEYLHGRTAMLDNKSALLVCPMCGNSCEESYQNGIQYK